MIEENDEPEPRDLTTKQQLVRILDLAYDLQKATEELYLNEVNKEKSSKKSQFKYSVK